MSEIGTRTIALPFEGAKTMALPWDSVFNAVTAALLAAFGVWIWTLRPRSPRTIMLGLFATAHGLAYMIGNLWDPNTTPGLADDRWDELLDLTLYVAALVGALGLARAVVEGAPRRAWGFTVAFVGVAALAVSASAVARDPSSLDRETAFLLIADFVEDVGQNAFFVAFSSLPLLFAWLYRQKRTDDSVRARSTWLLLSVALVPWPALYGTFYLLWVRAFIDVVVVGLLLTASTGLMWLANIAVEPTLATRARNAALLTFALMAFGLFDSAFLREPLGYSLLGSGPFFGLARLATTIVLAYAVTRHDVFGIDAKFRWGVSKSTIAATFVAVFFLATEGAQLLFGQENQIVGLIAAGALVFAMSPLQRATDRLAAKAVPLTDASTLRPSPTPSSEVAYRNAVRLAIRGGVTREEELHLMHMADELGLSARRALEIRHALEAEIGRT